MSRQYDILIIDDEQVVIDAVAKICTVEKLRVDAATDARQALVRAGKHQYRLIICDIMLPAMDGFQLLERMKPLGISTAFIMTTGYTTIENAVKSLYLGAIDFLPKPFTSEEFCSAVKRALKYITLREYYTLKKGEKPDNLMLYVPCPAKYLRLGYGSWLVQDHDGSVRVGVTDLFLKTIDYIEKISLQPREREIYQGSPCAVLETKDGLPHSILSPVSGRILEKNRRIEEDLTLMEKDPFFDGWLYRMIPNDLGYQLKYLIPGGTEEL